MAAKGISGSFEARLILRELISDPLVQIAEDALRDQGYPRSRRPRYDHGVLQRPAADGSRPGYYWVNLYEPRSRPSSLIEVLTNEAVLAISFRSHCNKSLRQLPNFRRYSVTFTEGWGGAIQSLRGFTILVFIRTLTQNLGSSETCGVRFVWSLTRDALQRLVRRPSVIEFLGIALLIRRAMMSRHAAGKPLLDIVNEIDRHRPQQVLALQSGATAIFPARNATKALGAEISIYEGRLSLMALA